VSDEPSAAPPHRGGAPKPCLACGQRPVAWTRPRVDYCYPCLPGGPFEPPACSGCSSTGAYYSQGRCDRCHHYAPQHFDSCRHCLAWGVLRKYKWKCWRCHSSSGRLPTGTCRLCHRDDLPLHTDQVCNLCDRQAVIALGHTIEEANATGQQLYFANMPWPSTRWRRGTRTVEPPSTPEDPEITKPVEFFPLEEVQHALFDMVRDLQAAQSKGPFLDPPNQQMAAFLDNAVLDHAHRHGWPSSTIHRTRHSMRVLQLMQDTPGTLLLATDAMLLQTIQMTAIPVIDVATAAGIMLDDRQPAIHAWFNTTTSTLPSPMLEEVTEWFEVMLHGSTTTPRRRPRSEQTARLNLRWAMPALTAWADQGHTSLREITFQDVRDVLPPAGNPRSTMGQGLRSILTLLKARKVLFINPIARVRTGGHERRDPLPAHAKRIRESLLSHDPACAALTALATFHGLRAGDLRNMHLVDLADGRLQLNNRTILLAEPVRVRLAAWLDYRTRRWPHTANPHVFLNHRNATRTERVGGRWLTLKIGIPVQTLREDRILHEAHTTGGDVRRICDLFGLTVEGALRYLPSPEIDDLLDGVDQSS
jgi:hypothetical protein